LCHDLLSKSGAGSKGGFDLSHQGIVHSHARSEVQRLDFKNSFLTVGFGIGLAETEIIGDSFCRRHAQCPDRVQDELVMRLSGGWADQEEMTAAFNFFHGEGYDANISVWR
jgi:hypothetical protein